MVCFQRVVNKRQSCWWRFNPAPVEVGRFSPLFIGFQHHPRWFSHQIPRIPPSQDPHTNGGSRSSVLWPNGPSLPGTQTDGGFALDVYRKSHEIIKNTSLRWIMGCFMDLGCFFEIIRCGSFGFNDVKTQILSNHADFEGWTHPFWSILSFRTGNNMKQTCLKHHQPGDVQSNGMISMYPVYSHLKTLNLDSFILWYHHKHLFNHLD